VGIIPTQTIEQIAAANDIVEVIGSYFPLKRAGANFKALCPFHQEKTPSFHVSPQRQTFHCFGCGVGGTVFRFVMDYEHVDFPSAVRKLAARVGIPVIEERGAGDDRQHEARRMLLQLHAEAAEWFHSNLLRKDFAKPARDYLKNRGIDQGVAKNWQIGYAPDEWDAFLNWALPRGYQRPQLLQSGLIKLRDEDRPERDVYDRFRGRIMFPICNDVGEVIAFSGRVLKTEAESAKYINSPETPLFRKGSVLFGLNKTKRGLIDSDCAVVCEGQLDLITLFEAGITNVVAPQGTAFTESQARILKRFVNEVVLCFDADAAGRKAAERSLDALLQNDLIVRVAEMPAGEDPDSLIRTKGKVEFEKRVAGARDFFDYWIEREAASTDLNSLGARMELARKVGATIALVRDRTMRGQLRAKAAAQLRIPTEEFPDISPDSKQQIRPPDAIDYTAYESSKIDFLCMLALRSAACRNYLLAQDWREVTGVIRGGTEPLVRILEADFNPDEPASAVAFMSSLPPSEESFFASLLARKFPANAEELVPKWWQGLVQEFLRHQLEAAESRMKLPQLSTGEVVNLQKQILDLREQLHELSQFSSAPANDS
jgi:DNA primase